MGSSVPFPACTPRILVRVSLALYDTGTRSVREFVPLEDGKVAGYYCCATVPAAPHIPPALPPRGGRAAPLAGPLRLDRDDGPQRHRHRRQDHRLRRGRGRALVADLLPPRARVLRDRQRTRRN